MQGMDKMDDRGPDTKQEFDLPSDFWSDYKHFIIKKGIRLHRAKFYIYWVRQFVFFLDRIPIQECGPDDVSGFLERLEKERTGVLIAESCLPTGRADS